MGNVSADSVAIVKSYKVVRQKASEELLLRNRESLNLHAQCQPIPDTKQAAIQSLPYTTNTIQYNVQIIQRRTMYAPSALRRKKLPDRADVVTSPRVHKFPSRMLPSTFSGPSEYYEMR